MYYVLNTGTPLSGMVGKRYETVGTLHRLPLETSICVILDVLINHHADVARTSLSTTTINRHRLVPNLFCLRALPWHQHSTNADGPARSIQVSFRGVDLSRRGFPYVVRTGEPSSTLIALNLTSQASWMPLGKMDAPCPALSSHSFRMHYIPRPFVVVL